jgi:imidazolonepropionase-like amidohydrolase
MHTKRVMLEPTLFVTEMQPSLQKVAPWCRAATGLAHHRHVALVAGTDHIMSEHDSLPNIHRELELLVASGLTPIEALKAATSNGAKALGLQGDYGMIMEGKVADLVVLDADPTDAIGNTRRIHWVIKGGRLYDPKTGPVSDPPLPIASPTGFPGR